MSSLLPSQLCVFFCSHQADRRGLPCHSFCAKVRDILQLPADVFLFLLFIHFHSVYSAWQSTTQNPQWAGWNGGNGWTGLVHGVCVCVCRCVCVCFCTKYSLTTPLAHLVVSPPTRDKITTTDLKVYLACLFVRRGDIKVTL